MCQLFFHFSNFDDVRATPLSAKGSRPRQALGILVRGGKKGKAVTQNIPEKARYQ